MLHVQTAAHAASVAAAHTAEHAALIAAGIASRVPGNIDIRPNTDGLPGIPQLREIVGAIMSIGLILAVAFLGFSLVKQLRKAEAAEEAGLYDPSDRKRPARMEIPQEQPAESPEPRRSPRLDPGPAGRRSGCGSACSSRRRGGAGSSRRRRARPAS